MEMENKTENNETENKETGQAVQENIVVPVKRGRGRPKGSKNKPKKLI